MRRSAKLVPRTVIAIALAATAAVVAGVSDTDFTYQGRLLAGGEPANGRFDIEVGLFDAETGGTQIGATLVFDGVMVSDGLITLALDYGAEAFADGGRWVEITVNGMTLAPRQAITRAPYAIQTRGIVVDDAGNVGIGTAAPQTRLDVVVPAELDEGETIQQVSVADAAGDFFRIKNSTGNIDQFITQLWGHHQTDDREAFQIIASTIAEQDVGTRPVLTFDAWHSDGDELTGSIVTRPPFAWNNGQSRLMTMDAQRQLGIGTSAPATALHIASTNPRLTLHDTNDTGEAQEGFISLVDAAGVETAWIGFVEDNNLYVDNNVGSVVIRPTGAFAVQDVPAVFENHGNQAVLVSLFSDRSWSFIQEGSGNATALKLQSVVDGDKDFIVQTDGGVRVRTHDGADRAAITTNNVGSGFVTVSRSNGSRVVTIGSTSPDRGGVFVLDDDDTAEGSILVNPQSGQSVVSVDEKNFRMENPREASTDIVFTCIEGPEAAVYMRGRGRLADGHAVVALPPHFIDVATAEGMTVQLTPRSAGSKGLAVVSQSLERFEVRELFDGHGDYEFSWKVMAVRRGHEDYRVIQPAMSAGRAEGREPTNDPHQHVAITVLAVASVVATASAQTGSTFTYQGRLLEGGEPANGSYDVEVSLWDAVSGGGQIGATLVFAGVLVSDGLITLELDYGAEAFDNGARWVEITVDGVTLAPRQRITRSPYSIQTRGIFVDDAENVGIGTTTPQTRLDVVVPAELDEGEVIQQVSVDDAAGDFFRIRNSTGNNDQFITMLWGHHATDDREAFQIIASTIAEQDAGTRPVLTFDAWHSDGDELTGSFVTRPPFAWNNGTSRLMTMDAQGQLGIGTSAPATALHIASTNPRLTLHDTNDTGEAQEGFISLVDAAGVETAWIGFVEDNNLYVDNNVGSVVIRPTGAFAVQDVPAVFENHGNQAVLMSLFSDRSWSFIQEGSGNATALKLQSIVDGDKDFIIQTDGGMRYRTHDGGERVEITTNNVDSGFIEVFGPNGSRNVAIGSTNANSGGIYIFDEDDDVEAFMIVDPIDGTSYLAADVKNFRVPNPRDPATEIVYACVEGPEAGAYVRGTGRLEDGRAVVELPTHFIDVATSEGMTVQVTPRSAASKGLAVVAQSVDRFEVAELFEGRGDYEFDWEVMAVRRGYEDYRVIRPRQTARQ